MDNWKNYKFLKIFLQSEDYEKLMMIKGSRSWHDWIGSLQAQKVQPSRPQPPDFRSEPARYVRYRKTATLRRLGLNKSKVCKFCFDKNYTNPQILQEKDFAVLIKARMPDLIAALGLSDEGLRKRFEGQSLPPVAMACPRCSAYANIRTFAELLDQILPELSQQQQLDEIKRHSLGKPSF